MQLGMIGLGRMGANMVRRLMRGGHECFVFDLNAVTYICSAGIGALVYNLNTVRQNNGAIYIISSNEYIEYMFQTLKFDMVFDGYIYPSIDEFKRRIIEGPQGT